MAGPSLAPAVFRAAAESRLQAEGQVAREARPRAVPGALTAGPAGPGEWAAGRGGIARARPAAAAPSTPESTPR